MLRRLLKSLIPLRIRELRRELILGWKGLSGPPPMKEFSDYDDYWEKRGKIKHILRRWQIAAENIQENSSLLDVGCGSGEFLCYVKSVKPKIEGKGIDFSRKSVDMTRAAGFASEVADIVNEAILEKYDYITCFEVLEHIAEAEIAIRHMKDSFRRQLIVSIPNVGYLGCRVRLALFGRFPVTVCVMHIKEHLRHWTPKDFREWLAKEELQVIRIEGQYGNACTPWKLWPSLFAKGIIYVIEHT